MSTGQFSGPSQPTGLFSGRCGHLTGIDLSPKTIERARDNLRDFQNISLIRGDFSVHPFQERFDVIYSSLTMMHFRDKSSVIRKISALLKAGGLFCLSIDKNQREWIDTGNRSIRIYPDMPEKVIASADRPG